MYQTLGKGRPASGGHDRLYLGHRSAQREEIFKLHSAVIFFPFFLTLKDLMKDPQLFFFLIGHSEFFTLSTCGY